VHWVEFVAEHWPQAPDGSQAGVVPPHSMSPLQDRQVRNAGSQMGVVPPQSALARQPTQALVAVLQTGVAPEQLLLLRHWTQVAVLVLQIGVDPPHRPLLVAEQAPQAPDAWQAGAEAGQSASAEQARQVWAAVSQVGVVPLQFDDVRQATQVLGEVVVRQRGVDPLQSLSWTHWSTNVARLFVVKLVAAAPERPAALIVAWLVIVPSGEPSTFTLNVTTADDPAAIVPPAVALAPVPRRTWTVFEADRYSPESSPVASVLAVVVPEYVTWMEPAT
jgi:hypothetical protein